MKKIISISAYLLTSLIVLSCTKNTSNNTNTTSAISMSMTQFIPASTTVPAGTTITWTNNDTMTHTVTSNSSLFNDTVAPGKTFSFKFTTAGTYPYKCTIHTGMAGTITVN